MPRLVAQPRGLGDNVQWAENSESTKDSGPAQGKPGSLNRRVGEKSFLFQPRSLSLSTYFLFKLPAESKKARTATAEL